MLNLSFETLRSRLLSSILACSTGRRHLRHDLIGTFGDSGT
jgi:hypothetical protein